jgi:hypothetical protein
LNTALLNGCPNIRWVDTPRSGKGEERVALIFSSVIKALTDPITAKEKESGLYNPPPAARIIFTGTWQDAQTFFQQTTPVANCRNCPISKYTDGLPIVIPTEEKVKEMLTGTSHKPDEKIVSYTVNSTTKQIQKGTNPVLFAKGYMATVEKVAIVSVMAGCKPEYLPVALAIATTGGESTACPGTSGGSGTYWVAAGPIAKEIGMNSGLNAMTYGNPPNMTLQRVGRLVTVNFGGCITGVARTDSGHPVGACFAEDEDGLPAGWETVGEEAGFKKTESVIGKFGGEYLRDWGFKPSSFRGLNSGSGGMARGLGVEGKPGNYNFLEAILPRIVNTNIIGDPRSPWGALFVIDPVMAKSLLDAGFKTKADVYKWMSGTYYTTKYELYNQGWWEFNTNSGNDLYPGTKIKWGDLPDDYKIPIFGLTPQANCIIVSAGFADEMCRLMGRGRPSQYPVDPWR